MITQFIDVGIKTPKAIDAALSHPITQLVLPRDWRANLAHPRAEVWESLPFLQEGQNPDRYVIYWRSLGIPWNP